MYSHGLQDYSILAVLGIAPEPAIVHGPHTTSAPFFKYEK